MPLGCGARSLGNGEGGGVVTALAPGPEVAPLPPGLLGASAALGDKSQTVFFFFSNFYYGKDTKVEKMA